ncbi:MAG: OmpA family protein [Desulfococcaceae bacterium]
MKKIVSIFVTLGLMGMLAGCGANSMFVLIPDPDGNVGQMEVSTAGGKQVLTGANQSVQVKDRETPPSEVKELTADEIRSSFSEALAAQPPVPQTFILYFMKDSNELTPESNALIAQILQTIEKRNSKDIVISGHSDTVGSKEYNYRLSLDRAKVLSDILVAKGAVPGYITVTSHGEGNPLVKTADDVEEPRNRRVEVVIK